MYKVDLWQWRKPVPPTNLGNEEPDDVDNDDEIILERLRGNG